MYVVNQLQENKYCKCPNVVLGNISAAVGRMCIIEDEQCGMNM